MSKARASKRSTKSETAKGNWFPIALFALFAVGCLADARGRYPVERRKSIRFQVEEDNELYADAKLAAEQWAKATGIDVTVTPDGDVPIVIVEELSADCTPRAELLACSYIGETPEQGWTEVSRHLDPKLRQISILRQMGHHLRGSLEHASEPDTLMSATGERRLSTITRKDVAFVCSGRFECSLPRE